MMPVEEQARRSLERRLEEVLGREDAVTLMNHLPRDEPATRADLVAVEGRLVGRIDGVEQRLGGLEQRLGGLEQRVDRLDVRFEARLEGLDSRLHDLAERIDLKTESVEHRVMGAIHELRGQMGESTAQLSLQMVAQTRLFVFAMVGALATISALAFAAARIT